MSSRLSPEYDVLPAGPDLDAAARLLRRGGVLAFPTETLYGLGCLALDAAAVAQVYQLKRRPVHKPLPLLAADAAQADAVADLSAMPQELRAFWPGPLTVLLPGRAVLPPALKDSRGLAAVRVTSHPLAAALALRAGGALTASSANRSGLPAARRPKELDRELLAALAAVNAALENSPAPRAVPCVLPLPTGVPLPVGGLPSTIVEPLPGGRRLRMLREGAVSAAALAAAGFVIVQQPPGDAPRA